MKKPKWIIIFFIILFATVSCGKVNGPVEKVKQSEQSAIETSESSREILPEQKNESEFITDDRVEGELMDIDTDMMKVLTDAGYTLEQANDIKKILNTIGVNSIEIYKMTGVATEGLNAVICYPNGLREQSSRFTFTTDNGVLFYAGFLGEDLYDSELGGYLKSYEDVHVPETKIDIDTYTKLQILAIDNVKKYLNHPSSADFNNFAWGVGRSDDKYKIQGEVTAQNSFGVKDDLFFDVYFIHSDDEFLIEGIVIDGIRVK
jgi:hypothetical protein